MPADLRDEVVADYAADVWAAGEDCRTRLACVRAWSDGRASEACRLLTEEPAE